MIYAGTSGWAYTSWKPRFYPARLPASKFLEHYAGRLNTVEINYTFRHAASEKTLKNWIASTPSGFRFSAKAHQRITHIKRLRDCEEPVKNFFASLAPLAAAGRLGPVLFQLPPNLKCDLALLKDFLAVLPRSARCAMEFRHESWLHDRVYDLLHKRNVALCVAEAESLVVPDVATADFAYYRFRMGEYTRAQRRAIRKRVESRAASGDVFCFFKHEDSPHGALYAEELLESLQEF